MEDKDSNSSIDRNPFVALCEYASQSHWCWNLACTTCGHSDFRVAFSKIIRGQHPDDESFWPNGRSAGSLYKEERSYPDFATSSTQSSAQLQLAFIVAKGNLTEIQGVSTFPDWLGYIGLVLHHCNGQEASLLLSKALLPQFISLVEHDREAAAYLQQKLESHELLTIEDLSRIEAVATR